MSLYFPVPKWNRQSYKEGMRQFGWRREKGKRLHAGCDIYAPLYSPVIAVSDGTVVEKASFYLRTFQISVNHPGIGVIRYGEVVDIPDTLSVGSPVIAGSQIGKIGHLIGLKVHPMLHFELFEGSGAGTLSNKPNKTDYLYVNAGPFGRRRDLKNPTELLDRLVVEGVGL